MTFSASLALFGSMLTLALIPGPGILAVVARTMGAGLRQGISTAAGIVAGDYVFITFALMGLATLSEVMGGFFYIIKYLGAGYLIWLGVSLAISRGGDLQVRPVGESGHLTSFAAGLFTTLGNPKAILFYLSFFPVFLDLPRIGVVDAAVLYGIATAAVGGVMFGYAYVTHKAKAALRVSKHARALRLGSGALLVSSGVFVATKG